MELKEKLRQILKERYGIENDAEIIKEARNQEATGRGKETVSVKSTCWCCCGDSVHCSRYRIYDSD